MKNAAQFIKALLLGIVSNALYAVVAQTINIWIILSLFSVTIIGYYLAAFIFGPLFRLKEGGIVHVFQNYGEAREAILEELLQSKKVKITTIGGGTIFEVDWGEFAERLKNKAWEGSRVQLLALHPDSTYLEERIKELERFKPGKFNLLEFKTRMHANILKVKDLHDRGISQVQLRYYNMLPTWRLYIFDRYIFISSYLDDKEGHDTTVYQVRSGTDLYRAFERFFDYLWRIGELPEELQE